MLRAVLRFDPASATVTAIRTCGSLPAGVEEALSLPRAITYPTTGSSVAHAFYYPPRNTARAAPEGSRPPLLVFSHGGPTSATTSVLNLQIQFFTSRGFAVVDVNYRGSSGFGRPYREALNEEWGIVDADDCANAARYLVMRGLADERRIGARGGSAGGYVTLCLAAYYDLLCVGASYYGVSDLLGLAESTHNLELRYLDRLVGPLPEAANAYRKRSPLHNATSVRCPLIFFQGRQDRAVPTEQTLMMVEALQRNRVPCVFTVYPGEQHGFRIAANIQDSLESELAFYALFMHFTPAATEGASD
jgi:dipeptidyl aminopeptidase/acylaminoacyl peptidase